MRVKNQDGFGVIGIVIMSLLAAMVICVIGLLVFYAQQHKPTKPAKTQTVTHTTHTASSGYFTLTEWDVRAPYTGVLTLQYQNVPGFSDGNRMFVGSSQLQAADQACTIVTVNGEITGPAGYIARYLPTDPVPTQDGSTITAQDYINQSKASGTAVVYALVGNYYYIYWPPTINCSSSSTAQQLQQQTQAVLQQIVPTLQAAN